MRTNGGMKPGLEKFPTDYCTWTILMGIILFRSLLIAWKYFIDQFANLRTWRHFSVQKFFY